MTGENKNILVIGGSGFVGKNLIPELIAGGYDVTVLNRGNNPMQGTKQLIANREDMAQLNDVARTVEAVDVVIDTSAYNRRHTAAAWAAFSKKTDHWIHLSSAAVYKETEGRYPKETDAIGGAAVWAEYGVEKSEADQFLIENAKSLSVTILRPPYLYGPGNNNDREAFIWARTLQNRSVVIPGNGQTPIQFLHIEDLTNIIKAAIEKKPRGVVIYNVGADERPTLSEWVATVAEVGGFADPRILAGSNSETYKPRQYFPFRDYPCCVEVGPVKSELGWQAKYSLAEGFRQTYGTQDVLALKARSLDTAIEDQILANIKQHSKLER